LFGSVDRYSSPWFPWAIVYNLQIWFAWDWPKARSGEALQIETVSGRRRETIHIRCKNRCLVLLRKQTFCSSRNKTTSCPTGSHSLCSLPPKNAIVPPFFWAFRDLQWWQ
jgi:hypothetical protein